MLKARLPCKGQVTRRSFRVTGVLFRCLTKGYELRYMAAFNQFQGDKGLVVMFRECFSPPNILLGRNFRLG